MHRHDLDLIAAYADGSLEDDTTARALVESCDVCQSEYQSQLGVLEALGDVRPAMMTEHEKTALHRDVWTALRSEVEPAKSSVPWWYRWSYAAAGVLVVVGVAGVLSQLGSQGNDEAGVVAAVEETEQATDGAAAGVAEDAIESAPESGETRELPAAADPDEYAALAQAARSKFALESPEAAATQELDDCLQRAGLEDHRVIEELETERHLALVIPTNVDLGPETPITFVDLESCEVVHVEE